MWGKWVKGAERKMGWGRGDTGAFGGGGRLNLIKAGGDRNGSPGHGLQV